jgi:hypothetical protein
LQVEEEVARQVVLEQVEPVLEECSPLLDLQFPQPHIR